MRLMYMYKDQQGFAFLNQLLKSGNVDKNLKFLKLFSEQVAQEIMTYKKGLFDLKMKSVKLKKELKKLVREKKTFSKW